MLDKNVADYAAGVIFKSPRDAKFRLKGVVGTKGANRMICSACHANGVVRLVPVTTSAGHRRSSANFRARRLGLCAQHRAVREREGREATQVTRVTDSS